uniref:hypothetical protein n=1 Tax=Paractinoplanes polyasparticus TaxID=2856853 RepID=UPI001C854075|nr:hypothetical protein [Actinoplanes polyasparticus]
MGLEIDFHDNEALVWSRPLALTVGAAGALLIAAAVLVSWAAPAGVFGGVALFVAVSGWIGSALELKYGDLPIAQPVAVAHHAKVRRRSARRSSGVPWVTVALGVVVVLVAAGTEDAYGIDYFVAACGLAPVWFGVLVGPVAGYVVTPQHLHIDTALWRVSVPRRLIGTFEHSQLEIRLRLLNRDFVDIRVDSPIMEHSSRGYWMNARCRVRTAEKLVRMLREVAEEPGTDTAVTRRRRPIVTAVAALTAVGIVALGIYGFLQYGV